LEIHQLLEFACFNEKYHHPQPLAARPFLGMAGEDLAGAVGQQPQQAALSSLTPQDAEPTQMFSIPSTAKVAGHMGGKSPAYCL